ncbi:hypothetical protein TURU_019104 [Turdus rufiventris]|nr:hypothetical protein TURU_019104 [Turdus rufiventris]
MLQQKGFGHCKMRNNCMSHFKIGAKALVKKCSISIEDARHIVATCPHCQKAPLWSNGINPRGLKASKIWQSDSTLCQLLKPSAWLAVTVDTYSGMIVATQHAKTNSKATIKHWVTAMAWLGIQKQIKTYNGTNFVSKSVQEFATEWNVTLKQGILYNNTGQAIVERANQTLKSKLETLARAEGFTNNSIEAIVGKPINVPFKVSGDFNLIDICWELNPAEKRQSRKFLEYVEDNFLSQLVSEPTEGETMLDLLFTNGDRLVGDVVVGGLLGYSDHEIIEFLIFVFSGKMDYPQDNCPPGLVDGVREQSGPLVIQEEAVRELLRCLDIHKSMRLDGIHPKVMRELADELAKPLSIIYQQSWLTGELPDDWNLGIWPM